MAAEGKAVTTIRQTEREEKDWRPKVPLKIYREKRYLRAVALEISYRDRNRDRDETRQDTSSAARHSRRHALGDVGNVGTKTFSTN